jgi:hypothetical protein
MPVNSHSFCNTRAPTPARRLRHRTSFDMLEKSRRPHCHQWGELMPGNPRRTFSAWIARPESIIGICAIIVSVVAVGVSAYEARIQREWQRAAVWPYIQLGRSFYYTDPDAAPDARRWTLTLNAENVGVGPAQVRDFHVTVDGKPQATWGAAMRALLRAEEEISYGQSTILGTIVPAQRNVQMFQYVDQPLAEKLYREMDERLVFSACFCSVFDECWQTTSTQTHADNVESCVADETSFKE